MNDTDLGEPFVKHRLLKIENYIKKNHAKNQFIILPNFMEMIHTCTSLRSSCRIISDDPIKYGTGTINRKFAKKAIKCCFFL